MDSLPHALRTLLHVLASAPLKTREKPKPAIATTTRAPTAVAPALGLRRHFRRRYHAVVVLTNPSTWTPFHVNSVGPQTAELVGTQWWLCSHPACRAQRVPALVSCRTHRQVLGSCCSVHFACADSSRISRTCKCLACHGECNTASRFETAPN